MIILDTIKKSLEVVLAQGGTLTFVTSYVDIDRTTMGVSASNSFDGAVAGITPVTIVGHALTTGFRQVNYLSLQNDSGSAVPLTLQLNNDTTARPIWIGTLEDGETLFYMHGRALYVLNGAGESKAPFDSASASIDLLTNLTASTIYETLQQILVELQVLNRAAQEGFDPETDLDDVRQELLNDN